MIHSEYGSFPRAPYRLFYIDMDRLRCPTTPSLRGQEVMLVPKTENQTENISKAMDSLTDNAFSLQEPLTHFSKFPLLPAELRDAIWRLAMLSPMIILAVSLTLPNASTGIRLFWRNMVHVRPAIGACKEAYDVSLKVLWNEPHARGTGSDIDIMFVPKAMYTIMSGFLSQFYGLPTLAFDASSLYFADMHQIAVEYDWRRDDYLALSFVSELFECKSLTHLFLVIDCKRPRQWVLDRAWYAAEKFHTQCSRRPQITGLVQIPLKITILLQRRKYNITDDSMFADFSNFLSSFTIVPYKPGYRARTGRHGVLRALQPILQS